MSKAYADMLKKHPKAKKETIISKLWPVFEPDGGRTKQAFKDSTDINKILAKAQIQGSISHLEKHGAFYGDFANAPKDLFEARELIDRGKAIFAELPAEVRRDFNQDPVRYFEFVNDPANKDRLHEVLPEIAKPGKYFPDVSPSTAPDALLGASSEPVASVPSDNSGSSDTGDSGASSA